MKLHDSVPSLPVASLAPAVEHYQQRFGFSSLHVGDDLAVLARDGVRVNLWQAADESWQHRQAGESPVQSGAESFLAGTAGCRIRVSGIDELFDELRQSGVLHPRCKQVERTWYGTAEVNSLDLDGNLLTFFEEVG